MLPALVVRQVVLQNSANQFRLGRIALAVHGGQEVVDLGGRSVVREFTLQVVVGGAGLPALTQPVT